ncbi:MAG: helix-turn-helix domain-containing protein [Bacteroidales bacterium]
MGTAHHTFLKTRQKQLGLTQKDMAEKAGVSLRFVRDLEQGKSSLQMDKVNQVLALFVHVLAPVECKKIEKNEQKS